MNKRTRIHAYLILLLAFSEISAGEIYTWIDPGGITHFSETPPDNPDTGATQLELQPAPAAIPGVDENYFSVINQAARMRTRRLENEKLRAERRAAEAAIRQARAEEQAALEAARQATSMEEPRYYPLFLHRPRYGHRPYPGHRPRPHNRHPGSGGRGNYFRSRRNEPVW